MDHFPGNWGNPRSRDETLFTSSAGAFPANHSAPSIKPITHTSSPVVTGTSVLAIKYKDGVMLAADNLASYGSLARFRDVERLIPAGEFTVVGASGDISDLQAITRIIDDLVIKEKNMDDGHSLSPKHIHEYLCRLMYGRRSKSNPLWNSLVVGGFKNGEPYLVHDILSSLLIPKGFVDLQGTSYESATIATGFGGYLAQPLLRKAIEGDKANTLSEQEARKVIEDCMRVLYYRDARSLNKLQIATINKDGVHITEPFSLDTEWGFAEFIRGYGA